MSAIKTLSKLWLLLLMILSCQGTNDTEEVYASSQGAEYKLFTKLFAQYNRNVRPMEQPNEPVYVWVGYKLKSILGIDEQNEILSTVGSVFAEWHDQFLVWDPADYDELTHIIIPPNQVWLPDLALTNSAGTFYSKTYLEDFRVSIESDGYVYWEFGGVFQTICNLDMQYYPFDLQKCTLEFENWAYLADQVLLLNDSNGIDTSEYSDSSLWNLQSTTAEASTEALADEFAGESRPKVTFTLYMERLSNYYAVNVILPCVFILFIALAMFFLPAGSGEKVSLGITVLLAFSVFQLVIMESTPVSSTITPLLTKFVTCIMALTTLSVTISILVIFLDHKSSEYRPPYCLRVVFLKGLARLFCVSTRSSDKLDDAESNQVTPLKLEEVKTNTEIEKKNGAPVKEIDVLLDILASLKIVTTSIDDNEHSGDIADEWKALGTVVDRMFFWLSLAATVVIVCTLFIYTDTY